MAIATISLATPLVQQAPQSFFTGIASDVLSGNVHWYAKADAATPTEAEIISGAGSVAFSSFAKNSDNPHYFNGAGLPEDATHHIFIMQVDAGDNSNILYAGEVTLSTTTLSNLVAAGLSSVTMTMDTSREFLETNPGGFIEYGVIDTPANIAGLHDYQVQSGNLSDNTTPALISFTNIALSNGQPIESDSIATSELIGGNTYQAAVLAVDDRTYFSSPRPVFSAPFVAQIVNTAPELVSNIANKSYTVGDVIDEDLSVHFNDADADTMTFTVSPALNFGLSLSSDCRLQGTVNSAGTQSGIVITASDGTDTRNSNVFSITVAQNQTAPIIESVSSNAGTDTVQLDSLLTLTLDDTTNISSITINNVALSGIVIVSGTTVIAQVGLGVRAIIGGNADIVVNNGNDSNVYTAIVALPDDHDFVVIADGVAGTGEAVTLPLDSSYYGEGYALKAGDIYVYETLSGRINYSSGLVVSANPEITSTTQVRGWFLDSAQSYAADFSKKVDVLTLPAGPVISGLTQHTISENATFNYDFTIINLNGQTPALSGLDASLFTITNITSDVYRLSMTAKNRELPEDAGSNNIYDVTINADDTINSPVSLDVAVSVENINEITITAPGPTTIEILYSSAGLSHSDNSLQSLISSAVNATSNNLVLLPDPLPAGLYNIVFSANDAADTVTPLTISQAAPKEDDAIISHFRVYPGFSERTRRTLYPENTHVVEVYDTKWALSGSEINDATVSVVLTNNSNEIPGQTWPTILQPEGGGVYRAVLTHEMDLSNIGTDKVLATVTVLQENAQAKYTYTIEVKSRG